MSEDDLSQTEDRGDTQSLDASMTVDANSLSSEEADFAREMGFGDDPDEEEANVASTVASEVAPADEDSDATDSEGEGDSSPAPASDSVETDVVPDEAEPTETDSETQGEPQDDIHADTDADTGADATLKEAAAAAEPVSGASSEPDSAQSSADWEEIQPRAASDGIQATLEARADQLRELESVAPSASIAADASTSLPIAVLPISESASSDAIVDAPRAEMKSTADENAKLIVQLAERDIELDSLRTTQREEDARLARDEKELEELRSERQSLAIERDHLIDQFAVTSGQLVQSKSHAEKLEASLRAARGALTPLPEGERALRAEVIGLRGRLEEAGEENQTVVGRLASSATELAIARARVEDRQHEVNSHIERVTDLEIQITEASEELAKTVARHRELLAMTTRLQADNNELRSAQAALEETLQARDLEILAREEHLTVTRQGLSARDLQLVDVNERLDQAQHSFESQEAELERRAIEHSQLSEKIDHREARIATLTETLARIEEAMGHPIPIAASASREMPQAEWTRPTLAQTRAPDLPQAKPFQMQMAAGSVEAPIAIGVEPTVAPEHVIEQLGKTESIPSDEANDVDECKSALSSTLPENATESTDSEIESAPRAPVLCAPPVLPTILSTWRDRRFAELLGDPSAGSVHAFLAARLQRHLGAPGPQYVYLKSLGGSLVDAEVRFVNSLHELGVQNIRMEVLDVDPVHADARRHKVELAGLGEIVDINVGDLDIWDADAPCHAILLSDALYAQPNADQFLDHITPTIMSGAIVLFADRIGSGPVQISASALNRLEELWELLPESLKTSEGLSVVPYRGDDGGFPAATLDPTRALLDHLEPILMAGFGHLADLIVGPARGDALSVEVEESMNLLESIMAIDESRSLTENLSPRHGVAVLAHGHAGQTEILGQTWPNLSR